MAEKNKDVPETSQNKAASEYQTPEIEAVVTPETLEREVQYSGGISQQPK